MAFERVRRTRGGDFRIRIPPSERALLRTLPGQLRDLLGEEGSEDPARRRLFPSATLDDTQVDAEYQRLTHDDLLAERLVAVETMERTLEAERLSEDELVAWLSVLNDLRLVLGIRLEVTEETTVADFAPDDPRAGTYAVYGYLTFLEDQVVLALSG